LDVDHLRLGGVRDEKKGLAERPPDPGVYPGPHGGAALSGISPRVGRFHAYFYAATNLRRLYCFGRGINPDEPEALFEGFQARGLRLEMSHNG
jgi:hypothetical protein